MIICLQYVGNPSIYNLNIAAKNAIELYAWTVKFLAHVLYNDTLFISFFFFLRFFK